MLNWLNRKWGKAIAYITNNPWTGYEPKQEGSARVPWPKPPPTKRPFKLIVDDDELDDLITPPTAESSGNDVLYYEVLRNVVNRLQRMLGDEGVSSAFYVQDIIKETLEYIDHYVPEILLNNKQS